MGVVDAKQPQGPPTTGSWRWFHLAAFGVTGAAALLNLATLAWMLMTQGRSLGALISSVVSVVVCIAACAFAYARLRIARRGAPEHVWKSPARSAFVFAVSVWMVLYVLAVVNISWLFDIQHWPVWARVMAAIAPALPIGGVIVALLRYLKREPDEYQRSLLTRAVLIATGLTFFVLTAWGFLELYVDAPHFPTSLAMTPFWLFFGLAQWWVRRRA